MIGRRHKRTVRDRESGLVFSWRLGQSSRLRLACAILVVVVLSGLVGGMVSVRVAPAPRLQERKAEMLAMPSGMDAVEWQIRCDEAGPFPSRFTPSSLPVMEDEVGRRMEDLGQPKIRYRAVMREFPKEQDAVYPPAASKGERVFPERSNSDEISSNGEESSKTEGRLNPRLLILAGAPTGTQPTLLPPLPKDISSSSTASTWRFVIRVAESGRVIDCMPAIGASASVPSEVENWVRSVRFGRKAAALGWFGIEVGFVHEP